MLGTKENPCLHSAASETWGLLLFVVDMVEAYGSKLPKTGRRLLIAGKALVKSMMVVKEAVSYTHLTLPTICSV
eukprot:4655170-Alexandrium_andersonii.AAC.1